MFDLSEKEILPGAKLYTTSINAVLFGSPAEILKFLLFQKQALPSVIVIPDILGKHFTFQASVEFLIYHFLFVQKGLVRGIKLKIFAPSSYLNLLKDLIRVTLLGIQKEEIEQIDSLLGLEEKVDTKKLTQIVKENGYFALKRHDSSILQIEDFIQFLPLDIGETVNVEETAQSGNNIVIEHFAENQYNIQYKKTSYVCNINFDEPQEPCYPINHSPLLLEERDSSSDIFSLRVLGSSEGFDPLAPANGYLMRIKGKWVLWDCPGYTENHLNQLDLGVQDMDAVFISHVHEDHLDIMQIIREDKPIEIYTVPAVFHCILLKAVAALVCSYDEAKKYFNYHPIYPNKPFELFGFQMEVFYSLHVIPAIGMKMVVPKADSSGDTTLFVTGDHASENKIRELNKMKVFDEERNVFLQNYIPNPLADHTFIDAGKGAIHGDEREYKEQKVSEGKQVYFMHTRSILSLSQGQKLLKHGQHIIFHQ